MGIVIDPADVCEHSGVDNFSINYDNCVITVPDYLELKKLADHLGKTALSSFATSFNAYGWICEIGATDFAEVATHIE